MTEDTPDLDKSSNANLADSQAESEASKEAPIAILRVHDLEGAAIVFLPNRFGEIIGQESAAQVASEIENHMLTITKRTATDIVFSRLSLVVHQQQSKASNAELDFLKSATKADSDHPASELGKGIDSGNNTSDVNPGSLGSIGPMASEDSDV